MISDKFVILGALINLAGTLAYVVHTLQGRTKPNRISWFMWTLAPFVAFAAELGEGVGLQALVTFMAGFNPFLILLASFVNRKSVWKLTRFDFLCGALSLLGLLLWAITREGNIAIWFSIFADGLAAVPTIIKSYGEPESESWIGYFSGGFSAFIGLLTIKHWTFATYGFPVYILCVCALLTVLIKFKLGPRLEVARTGNT
ncbi:MAG TPA: hypothetical protein VFW90_02195 [Candidatus Saccharimonadales bacterium]|nr:hypothetical protein [Candidatus Saccharimonadales bacterium]